MRVLAFDIGIRNLAWCCLERAEDAAKRWTIHGWENYDLVAGQGTQAAKTAAAVLCACGKKAGYQGPSGPACARCCPADRPALRDASGALLKTLPKVAALTETLRRLGVAKPPKGKASILEALAGKVSLPIVKAKAARHDDLVNIHNAIQTFVRKHRDLFRTATHILLENQPVLKNPTMKSVQILLFATLRDLLEAEGQVVTFVHAGKKVKGAATGDAGYADRKKGSEDRVAAFLDKEPVEEKPRWRAMLSANQKRSDLCDALCMCVDRILA
jgi:hypothetical protein